MRNLVHFTLFVLSIQQTLCAFSADTFTLSGKDGTGYFLKEYKIDGTELQRLSLPNAAGQTLDLNGVSPRIDSTGTILSIGMGVDRGSNYAVTFDVNGVVDTTKTESLSSGLVAKDSIVEGNDVWLPSGGIKYLTRGATTSTATIIGSGTYTISHMQLVGTRLWAINRGVSLNYMDPIIKTGTGTLTPIPGTQAIRFIYFYSPSILYTIEVQDLVKYTVSGDQLTKQYQVTVPLLGIGIGPTTCYAYDIDGVTYVLVTNQASTASSVQRYTDDGSSFGNSMTLLTASSPLFFAGVGPSPQGTCSDGVKNQDETDVDCGGAKCGGCAIDKACVVNSDCLGKQCTEGLCAASCTDSIKNQGESDVDCGGINCGPCANDKTCTADGDCSSDFCDPNGFCKTPTCQDTYLNQDETDVDCGGNTCSKCANDKSCIGSSDCSSGYCDSANKCATPTCNDGVKNQDESDVDCGGNTCSTKCADFKSCVFSTDCSSKVCSANQCVAPKCDDGYKNQDETDVDCGGITCSSCAVGKSCIQNSDCDSNTCVGSVCANAPVAPVAAPVADTPVDVPVSTESPQSASPVGSSGPVSSTQPLATPIKQKGVSTGTIVGYSMIGLLITVLVLLV